MKIWSMHAHFLTCMKNVKIYLAKTKFPTGELAPLFQVVVNKCTNSIWRACDTQGQCSLNQKKVIMAIWGCRLPTLRMYATNIEDVRGGIWIITCALTAIGCIWRATWRCGRFTQTHTCCATTRAAWSWKLFLLFSPGPVNLNFDCIFFWLFGVITAFSERASPRFALAKGDTKMRISRWIFMHH